MTGFLLSVSLACHSTTRVCPIRCHRLFRNALLEKNVTKRLFDKFNHQRQRSGVLIREETFVAPEW
ncbi:MAG: hypothetical protein HQK81_11615 [Desulfovibrionaceae bacterium]|nr:hypothetical protein [Desulfovibrionaceae bacterium]